MDRILEVIFSLAIIIVLLVFFGVPFESILVILAAVLLGLICLAMVLFVLFFLITDLLLIFRKRTKGIFVRIDDSTRFDHAVYLVDGEEYHCTFPAETFGRKRIYHENQPYYLLISTNSSRRSALDSHSMITICIGTVFSAVFIGLLLLTVRYVLTLIGY
ncbi:MAG: hypothetical protein IKQ91_11355 [Oscillospiraceae bacterium]|nr:hypothetical protein [Oscillospiraceae bacterium]